MSRILAYIKDHYKPTLKDFNENLIKDGLPIIGLSVPECREIAKHFVKEDCAEILNEEAKYHEETFIKGIIIGYLKEPFSKIEERLRDFVHQVDNWATCDCTVSTLKIFKKHKQEGLDFIEYCFYLNKTYTVRVAYVLLLNYYLEMEYLDYIFEKVSKEKSNEYYIRMAVAWLISYLFIKFPSRTLELFDGRLDKFTHNKAISKITDSFRVTSEQKEMIKKYRVK